MRFGVTPAVGSPVASGAFLARYAQTAEELGFDSAWFPDHVVLPLGHQSDYPYGERMPYEDVELPEPLLVLAYVAAATSTLRLGTSVLILPQRSPVILAKQVATLDAISGGRVDLGVGIGWLREEFEALGVPWARRGRRMDEYIEAVRALWSEPEATYHGETVSFDRLKFDPKPVQPGGVPIIIGGHSSAAARRAGRLGNGFFPNAAGRHWRELLEEMREAAREAGRDPEAVEILAGGLPDPRQIERLAELGVSRMLFQSDGRDLDSEQRSLERIAAAVMAAAG